MKISEAQEWKLTYVQTFKGDWTPWSASLTQHIQTKTIAMNPY